MANGEQERTEEFASRAPDGEITDPSELAPQAGEVDAGQMGIGQRPGDPRSRRHHDRQGQLALGGGRGAQCRGSYRSPRRR